MRYAWSSCAKGTYALCIELNDTNPSANRPIMQNFAQVFFNGPEVFSKLFQENISFVELLRC